MKKEELIRFEREIIILWEEAKIPFPIHFSGGNEDKLIEIFEDNNRSVETPKIDRYGKSEMKWPACVRRYNYEPMFPHVGTNKWVNFSKDNNKDDNIPGVSF